MQVKLKVLKGSSAGQELKIPRETFLIGRGDECHLRPKSDTVSRKHCELTMRDGKLFARDMGSRNGTHVNEELIEGHRELKLGDILRVGQLEFEVLIDHAATGAKMPKVQDVKQAAARAVTVGSTDSHDPDDISSWLTEADEVEQVRRMAAPDTRQYKIDPAAQAALDEAGDDGSGKKGKKKKEYGKLPPRTEEQAKDSKEAASNMLRKMLNRG